MRNVWTAVVVGAVLVLSAVAGWSAVGWGLSEWRPWMDDR